MNDSKAIFEKIQSAKQILLSLHVSPDGDSLGSCVAMKYALEHMGKEVTLVSPDPLPTMIAELSIASEVTFGKDVFDVQEGKDLLLALDVPVIKRLSKKDGAVSIPAVRIDHHDTKNDFAQLNLVDPKQPSTCSLLLRFFKEMNVEIDEKIAQALLLGICTDTNFFVMGHNIDDVFADVQYLITKGARYNAVLEEVYYNKPVSFKKAVGKLLNNLQQEETIAYTVITKEDMEELGVSMSDMRIAIKELTGIKGADILFALVYAENGYKGSLRSQDIDIAKAAEELGGGGHSYAAGFFVEGSKEEAIEKTLTVVKKYL